MSGRHSNIIPRILQIGNRSLVKVYTVFLFIDAGKRLSMLTQGGSHKKLNSKGKPNVFKIRMIV